MAKELRALGLKVTTGIAKTGVVGVLQGKGPGPVIAVRADMDALPVTEAADLPFKSTAQATYVGREVGVSHACGHDIHVAAALGAASVLSSLRDRFNGTVMFIFQPAEEGPPPARRWRRSDGSRKVSSRTLKPDAIIALHTNGAPPDEDGDVERLGRLWYTPGPAFAAATKWTAIVRGRSAHASAPHLSVDPVVTASQIVLALQTLRSRILPPLSANVITVGIIRGGDRNNIIPAEVYLEGTIRRSIRPSRTRSRSACATSSMGRRRPRTRPSSCLRPSPSIDEERPPLTDRMVPTLQRVVGKENVSVVPPETGAEDFSFFSNIVPGFYYKLGVVPEGKASGGHHTPTFYADDQAVPIGIRALSTLVLDYLAVWHALIQEFLERLLDLEPRFRFAAGRVFPSLPRRKLTTGRTGQHGYTDVARKKSGVT